MSAPDERCNCDDLEDLSACPVHDWEECGEFDEDYSYVVRPGRGNEVT